MELAAGPPAHWVVTLVGGSRVDVWADAVTGLTEQTAHLEHIVFGVLMDIDADLQAQFEVTACGTPRASVLRWQWPGSRPNTCRMSKLSAEGQASGRRSNG